MTLSDLSGPDADGWSDVAVFVRSDGSESGERFLVHWIDRNEMRTVPINRPNDAVWREIDNRPVRRLGRGRLVPARIEIEGEATAEAKLREAIRDAGFAVMETSGKWSIHCVTDAAKQAEEVEYRLINENIDLTEQVRLLRDTCDQLATDLLRASIQVVAEEYPGLMLDIHRTLEKHRDTLAATATKERP